MNRNLLHVLLFLFSFVSALANESVVNLIDKIETDTMLRKIPDVDFVVENYNYLDEKIEAFGELKKIAPKAWRSVLENINSLSSDRRKMVFFLACRDFPKNEYIDFIHSLAHLCKQGEVEKNIFWWSVYPGRGPNMGRIHKEKDDPRVQKVLRTAGKIFAESNPNRSKFFLKIAGDQEKETKSVESKPVLKDALKQEIPRVVKSIPEINTPLPIADDVEEKNISVEPEKNSILFPVVVLLIVVAGLGLFLWKKKK